MKIIINTEQDRRRALDAVREIRSEPVMVVTIEKFTKKRSNGQNSLQWVALLGDFSLQAIIGGKQFSAKVWHEHLKELFLPEHPEEGMTLKGYAKWLEMPDGKLKLIGSTTKLTTKGFSDYMEQCYAYGTSELDVRFSANPNEYQC